jgi:hypothetical protein
MENIIQIGRGELKAIVAKPGTLYSRARFDWTGFIPQVTYRGKTFCTSEEGPKKLPSTGGEGLNNEYKASDESMGWDDADRYFLKPGVGLLERVNDRPYSFFTDYPIKQAFPCEMEIRPDTVSFCLGAIPHKGVAYTIDKHVAIMGSALFVTTTLHNVGEKPLEMSEYNHNFITLDNQGTHPQVTLTLNPDYTDANDVAGLVKNHDSITFTDQLEKFFMIRCNAPVAYAPKRWEMRDDKAGMRVQEWGDFDVTDFYAWGGRHVIAPEIYGDFPVAPGRKRSWTRVWKFYVD